MILRRLLTITILLTSTIWSQAQQINAVPDYVFRNQMSVGRNAVTDTAAYFSIGPRYGATKGFMPPIVGDTATFSSGKRNGLLIFSVQKNKFLYWDSVRVQWSDMAGSSGAYIVAGDTAAMLAPYLRKADTTAMLLPYIRHAGYGLTKSGQSFLVDTLNIATRAWRQKGIDSVAGLSRVGGSGTTNYVPKFTAGSTIGNSQIFDNGTNVGINTTTPTDYLSFGRALEINSSSFGAALYLKSTASTTYGYLGYDRSALQTILGAVGTSTGIRFDANGSTRMTLTSGGDFGIGTVSPSGRLHLSSTNAQQIFRTDESTSNYSYTQGVDDVGIYYSNNSASRGYRWINGGTERLRIFANGRVFVGASPTDAGYQLDINGTLRSVNGANFATTSGSVGIGLETVTAGYKMQVDGNPVLLTRPSTANNTTQSMLVMQAGADATLGPIGGGISLRTSASGARRWMELSAGDNADFRNIYFPRANVGIGDTSASYKLDVTGTLRSTLGANFATTSGNVGIGTASPAYKFHVLTSDATIAAFRNSGAANGQILIGNTAGDLSIRTLSTGDSYIFSDAGKYLDFGSNASFRMRLTSDGELLVSTTTDAGDYKLQVSGNIYTTGNIQMTGSAAIRNTVSQFIDYGTGGSGDLYIRGGSGFANVLTATNAGEVLVNTTTDAGDYKLQVSGNIYNTGSAVLAATSGNVGIGTTPSTWTGFGAPVIEMPSGGTVIGQGSVTLGSGFYYNAPNLLYKSTGVLPSYMLQVGGTFRFYTAPSGTAGNAITFTQAMTLNEASELLVATTSDAGDYKLQVVGNARVGTGKLDIASNTTFGLGVARSGTSEVAGQIYNSNGILYFGAESSAGGQIFSGSSAYAAVIGSGANYPLQFAVNNATYATLNTNGRLLINTKFDNGAYPLQVAGSVYNTGQVTRGVISVQGTGAQVFVDSTTNLSPFTAFHSLSGSNISPLFSGNATWNTTGNVNGIDLYVTNTASGANSNFMQLSDGTNIFKVTKDAGVVTAAPTGGSIRKWKLGESATVSPTSPNRTIRVEIDGTVYYLHAKTTND